MALSVNPVYSYLLKMLILVVALGLLGVSLSVLGLYILLEGPNPSSANYWPAVGSVLAFIGLLISLNLYYVKSSKKS